MDISELRAELRATAIEFEKAMDQGAAHADLIKIYREMKELQYQITLLESEQPRPADVDFVVLE